VSGIRGPNHGHDHNQWGEENKKLCSARGRQHEGDSVWGELRGRGGSPLASDERAAVATLAKVPIAHQRKKWE